MPSDRVCRMSLKNAAVARAPLSEERVGSDASEYQITSIDGFFNRKRGRPPKNRFVEVYKNAQQTPQAIFTSFKLDREAEHSGRKTEDDHGPTTRSPLVACSVQICPTKKLLDRPKGRKAERSQRRMRHYLAAEREKYSHSKPLDGELCLRKKCKPIESQTFSTFENVKISSQLFTHPAPYSCASVVRATGTFYPENMYTQTEEMDKATSVHSEPIRSTVASDRDYEEAIDLRISTQKTKASSLTEDVDSSLREQSNNLITFPIQHLKQFFQLFQMQHDFQRNNSALLPIPSAQMLNEFSETALNIEKDITASPTKAEPIGYFKFDHGENCGFIACSYKQRESHFHCKRKDCYYSCCDKSLSIKHLAGHQRLDSLK